MYRVEWWSNDEGEWKTDDDFDDKDEAVEFAQSEGLKGNIQRVIEIIWSNE